MKFLDAGRREPAGNSLKAQTPPRWLAGMAARVSVALVALLVAGITPAYAAPKDLNSVIDGIRTFAMGVLFTLTTLYLTVAGIRYVLAGGSPHAMEEAKTAVKNSLLGYALAALAPLLADIVKGIVG
jgi:Type IV secretion system pilin